MLSYFMVIIRGQNNAEFAMKLRTLYIINFKIDLIPKCSTLLNCISGVWEICILMYHIMSWLLMTL